MELITNAAREFAANIGAFAARFSSGASLTIMNDAEYRQAAADLKAITAREKEVEAEYKALREPLVEAESRLRAFFDRPRKLLADSKQALKTSIADWERREAERVRREQEERRRAEEAERERLRQEALELERQAAEKRKAEEERIRKLEEQGKAKRAEAARLKAEEEERARLAEAARARTAAEFVEAPPVAPVAAPAEGLAKRKVWKYRVTDITKVPATFLQVNEALVLAHARSTKGTVPIEGIEIYCEETTYSTGR